MDILDQLELIDGWIDFDRFGMRSIGGQPMYGVYKVHGLRALAEFIDDDVPFYLFVHNEKKICVPVQLNKRIKKELLMIAAQLEKNQQL